MDTRRSNGDDASPSSLSSPPAEADDTTQQQQQQRQSTYSYDYRDPNQSREHGSETLSPLEREVLDEYVKLRDNLDRVRLICTDISTLRCCHYHLLLFRFSCSLCINAVVNSPGGGSG